MIVILIVTARVAQAMCAGDSSEPVLHAIREQGAHLYTMPAFAPGEPGERTFTIETSDAQSLCAQLRALPGVEACYTKPMDEPP